ncbi:MAG: lipid-A-disaccharide synthase N-terminal domain-containing protein [Hyphomicrobiaceae bacterium]
MITAKLAAWWAGVSMTEVIWVAVGFIAQLMFSMRFLIQWIASERAKQSIVPETFWYFSVLGGAMLFAYATWRLDPVFMLGQGMGLFIYARNIQLIWRQKAASAKVASAATASEATSGPGPAPADDAMPRGVLDRQEPGLRSATG